MESPIITAVISAIASGTIAICLMRIYKLFYRPKISEDHRIPTKRYEFLVFYEISSLWWISLLPTSKWREWATNIAVQKVERKLKRYYKFKDEIDQINGVLLTKEIINQAQ